MRRVPSTVLGRLIAGSLLVQVLVFILAFVLHVHRERLDEDRESEAKLRQQAAALAAILHQQHSSDLRVVLRTVMPSLSLSGTLHGVRLTDAAGALLSASDDVMAVDLDTAEQHVLQQLRKRSAFTMLRNTAGRLEGAEGVLIAGTRPAYAWLVPDETLTRRYTYASVASAGSFALLAALGMLLLTWWFVRSVHLPFEQLRGAAAQMARSGQQDLTAFPLPADAPNEIGELQNCFNAMARELTRQRRNATDTFSLLDAMLESAPAGFVFYDREFRFVRLNETLARMHGLNIEEHLGKRYRDLFGRVPNRQLVDDVEAMLQQVFDTGQAIPEYEFTGVAPGDESMRTWRTSLFPVFVHAQEVRYVGVIVMDVTERKLAQEALRANERLATAGRLAGSLVHQISNPLEAVTNLLYLLQLDATLSEGALGYIGMAQGEIARVSEITQHTLKFCRHSSEALDVHLSEILRSVLVLSQAQRLKPHIEVKLKLNDDAVVFGYPGELRQVFAQLISNAIDSMPAGGTLYLRARRRKRHGKSGVRVTIADTGGGMSPAVLSRMFEPFFTTDRAGNTGLGLWISAESLQKHSATTSVRSRLSNQNGGDGGTVFSLFFPCDGVPRGPVRVRSAAHALADHVL